MTTKIIHIEHLLFEKPLPERRERKSFYLFQYTWVVYVKVYANVFYDGHESHLSL